MKIEKGDMQMSWSKIFTAFKGAVSETTEKVADNQAIRIMDQEIREADVELNKAKTELTKIMAKRKGVARKVDDLSKKITEHEGFAGGALEKGDEDLARDICERIGGFEQEHSTESALLESFNKSEQTLKSNLKKAEVRLKQLKQQQDVIKATEAVQSVQGTVAAQFSGSSSKMGSAMDSLDRIKQRQQERSDRFDSAGELAIEESGSDLDKRMQDAGIGQSVTKTDDIMARLKAKK
jgi:phage shock protein A